MPGVSPTWEEYCSASRPPCVCLTLLSVCNALMYSSQYHVLLRHLDTLFLGIDGCFKTKLKDCGIMDPDLGTGLAYMVNDVNYAAHLKATAGMPSTTPVSARICTLLLQQHLPLLTRKRLVALISMWSIRHTPRIRRATLLQASLLSLVVTHSSAPPALLIYRKVKSE